MEILIERFYEKYAQTSTKIIREFIHQVDWSNRFVGIKGSRGVGKTTLVMQYIKQNFKPGNKVLYASLDHFYFSDNRVYDLANDFYKKGGVLLALDEVHRYPAWSTELKNIYDDFPGLKVIFTGSSLLQLRKASADLSRRAVMYTMPGLSFREFISIETGIDFPVLNLESIVENHLELSTNIIAKIKPLVYFESYLNYGYYPFYLESKSAFHQKLNEIIQVVLEVDIPQYESMLAGNIIFLKKLLQVLAGTVPFKPNYHSISQRTGISVNTLKNYLQYLSNAQLIAFLNIPDYGLAKISKPEKIYLDNTNLMYSLAGNNWNRGSVRETFFLNQVEEKHTVSSGDEVDFLVDGKFFFEVGGKSKPQKQINNLDRAFIVKDGIEVGNGNIIPLWLFGFLY